MSQSKTEDMQDLARFGYRQELDRSLGSFSSFAAGFSYISILTGVFQMFYLGHAAAGPAFFWTWPVVFLGQFTVALGFAELAAHYPLSGGVYQWSRRIGSAGLGWMAGWVYLATSASLWPRWRSHSDHLAPDRSLLPVPRRWVQPG